MSVGTRVLGVASVCVLLGACQTTGNPREGGLFGWSRDKADARQAELQAKAATVSAERDGEQAAAQANQAQRRAIADEIAELDQQLSAAELESQQLEDKLAQLAAKNRAASEREKALLLAVRTQRARREAALQDAPPGPATTAPRQRRLGEVQSYNSRLNAAILRMLAD